MISSEDELFSYSDLPLITPWLNEKSCRQLTEEGLFTPRRVLQASDSDSRHMNLYDLIALTSIRQVLRSGITEEQLQQALRVPSSFRCGGFAEEDLLFLSTGCVQGQELSRFLEITNADVTILVRVPLVGEPEIEVIPNGLLEDKDFKGETLTGIDCKRIRDLITANIACAQHQTANAHDDNGRVSPTL